MTEGKIRRLPEELIAKIAAGEVVERPASVVKELVENALDAMAKSIDVRLEAGGLRTIEVRDDGIGMTPADAKLAIERHATSKISSEDDLFAVRTLGFRGEALPSIAAVSRLTLRTRPADANEGFRFSVEGPKVVAEEPTAMPQGTWITAADLFFNTPARRKFMKSERSELGACAQIVSRLALARPDVEFRVNHQDRSLLDFPRASQARRAADVLGERVEDKLLKLDHEEGPLKVGGFAGSPLLHWPNSAGLYLYVNGRYFRDRVLVHAVCDAFSQAIPPGRFPIGVLMLDIDPKLVDVNVHPQKIEVRFRDTSEIYRVVRTATLEALGPRLFSPSPLAPGAEVTPAPPAPSLPLLHHASVPQAPTFAGPAADANAPVASDATSMGSTDRVSPTSPQGMESALLPVVLGQVRNTFILCEGPQGLLVIDQHTAHERVLFEKLKGQLQNGGVTHQALLMPEIFKAAPQEAVILHELIPMLDGAGMDIEPMGSAFAIKSIPSGLNVPHAESFLRDLLREWSDAPGDKTGDPREHLLDLIACRAAVKAGDELNPAELESLVAQTYSSPSAYTCPHGRPVLLEWTFDALEKAFKRK
ncbi:MAG: DNA mismatch repair endonuclease MutL [Nitrospirae bacterium]|nr:DNA mismatch repair endonuclease MutL [Nitrospirota bacterium]